MEPVVKKMRLTVESDSKETQSHPLLKLPLLAQIEVIKSLTPSEQYLLSKCSKRSRQAVKSSYSNKKPSREVWVQFHRGSVTQAWESQILMHFYLKIGGKKNLIHESPNKLTSEQHEEICDLFSAPPDVYACFGGSTPSSEDFTINRLIKRSNLLNWKWRHQLINQYSELHPEQDLVLFDGTYINNVKEGHSFLKAKNLMISDTKFRCAFNIIFVFEGEHLLMEDVQINKFFIYAFVSKWMRQEDDRLKSVILQLQPDSVIGDLKYDTFTGRDKQFQYDSPIKEYHQFPNGIFNCSDGYDVRRETDGKSATITIIGDHFMFFVW